MPILHILLKRLGFPLEFNFKKKKKNYLKKRKLYKIKFNSLKICEDYYWKI